MTFKRFALTIAAVFFVTVIVGEIIRRFSDWEYYNTVGFGVGIGAGILAYYVLYPKWFPKDVEKPKE